MTDPNGWAHNPPSVFVKVINTSQETVNGTLAVVLSFQADRGRYIVVTPTQVQLSFQPQNLVECTFVEKYKLQYEFLRNDPNLQRKAQRLIATGEAWSGLSFRMMGVVVLVGLLFSIYVLGLSRTLLWVLFVWLGIMLVGPDLGKPWPVIHQQSLQRFKTVLQQSGLPYANRLAQKNIFIYLLLGIIVLVFVTGMMPPAKVASSASSSSLWNRFLSRSTTTTSPPGFDPHHYYKLGYDDAMANREFGSSIPATRAATTSTSTEPTVPLGAFLDDVVPRPPRRRQWLSMGNALSIFSIYRILGPMGWDGTRWDWRRLQQGLAQASPWQLGLLGLAVYRIVSVVLF